MVAVVGDGALTGGMCWEALNNVAGSDRPVVIVVNDNGRSYAPTIGGLSERLSTLRLAPRYEEVLEHGKRALQKIPVVGGPLYSAMHAAKAGVKDAITPQALFSDLGIKYVGPVDGHDVAALETALSAARDFGAPVIVHAVTYKGRGFPSAEQDQADQMHSVGVLDPETGLPVGPKPREWTAVFTEAMLELGGERSDVVAITAAMPGPTGLSAFGEAYPERLFDVGIAEAHAMTSAAGLAHGGLHPVVAIYSTFLNRAFDQLLMDVALHREPVTVVLDRAGVTGSDGAAPQRHVGPVGHGDRPRAAGGGAARRGDAARGAARGGRASPTGRRPCAGPRARCPARCPRCAASDPAGSTASGGPGAVDVLAEPGRLSRAAPRPTAVERLDDDETPGGARRAARRRRRLRPARHRGRGPAHRAGDRRDGGRPALGAARARGAVRARGGATGWW